MSLTTWLLRRAFRKGDDLRDAGLTTPEGILRRDGIVYGTDPIWQTLDVYRPKGREEDLPVIVSVHGGGWTYGDKERYQYYCMDLARRGFAVVNFTYRTAPEHKFPAGIEDMCLVFSWILENGSGFDQRRVYAVGDSAGAHMLTIYGALCCDAGYASRLGVRPPAAPGGGPFLPAALALNCGVYRIVMRGKGSSMMTRGLMRALLPHRGTREETDLVNPLPYVGSRFPKSFIMTANRDPLAGPPKQKGLTARLEKCGVPFIDRTYGSDDAPLGHVFHLDIRSESAGRCNDDECAFFLADAAER